jgi:hypothetical protein
MRWLRETVNGYSARVAPRFVGPIPLQGCRLPGPVLGAHAGETGVFPILHVGRSQARLRSSLRRSGSAEVGKCWLRQEPR